MTKQRRRSTKKKTQNRTVTERPIAAPADIAPRLIKPAQAAATLGISRRQLYDLVEENPDIAAAVLRIPGTRGLRIRLDRLEAAIRRMSGENAA